MKIRKRHFLILKLLFSIFLILFFSCTAPTYRRHHAPRTSPRNKESLTAYAKSFFGTVYKYGGTDRSGMDCSGFVIRVYGDIFGMRLPHNSRELFKLGKNVSSANLQTGDLIFFRGRQNVQITHVAIFLSGTTFIHASSSKGVILSKLGENYYKKRYAGAKRLF